MGSFNVGDPEVPGAEDLPGEGALISLLRELTLLGVVSHLLQDSGKAEKR